MLAAAIARGATPEYVRFPCCMSCGNTALWSNRIHLDVAACDGGPIGVIVWKSLEEYLASWREAAPDPIRAAAAFFGTFAEPIDYVQAIRDGSDALKAKSDHAWKVEPRR